MKNSLRKRIKKIVITYDLYRIYLVYDNSIITYCAIYITNLLPEFEYFKLKYENMDTIGFIMDYAAKYCRIYKNTMSITLIEPIPNEELMDNILNDLNKLNTKTFKIKPYSEIHFRYEK